ncbi:MAG: 4Fe-4S dicluster domain-containing protein [Chloroflexota bacterium]|nr:MAG: 4Fe-4S dicluster domain-containing protein [Chloroflexota bacterium]
MTRVVFWNIEATGLFYLLSVIAIAVFLVGFYRVARIWRSGWGERRERNVGRSVKRALLDGLLGRRIFRGDVLGGFAHFSLMWGFVLLFIGTVLLTVHHDIVPFLFGTVYLTYSLVLDIAGAFFIVAALLAAFRRFVLRANHVPNRWDDPMMLALLFLIALTGFVIEGLRLSAISHLGMEWSPVGDLFGAKLGGLVDLTTFHGVVWWIHALAALGLVAYLPYSKLFHMFAAPTHLYLSTVPPGIVTLEEREGLRGELDRTELVSLDACTRCNRCEVVCPSYAAGEPLSPRALVQSMKSFVRRKYAPERQLLAAEELKTNPPKIEEAVARDECWYCTTCVACAEACPIGISAADIARETRVTLVDGGRRVPKTIRDALNNVGKYGNPWEHNGPKHYAWLKTLEAKDLSQGDEAELCYFVGCLASNDERNQAVARALVKVLNTAGVDFGILGKEESCCGEFARRLGEDGLFEALVEGNYGAFKDLGVSRLVSTSPHCFHTMRNEYPVMAEKLKIEAAPSLEVRHHTTLLADLLRGGALRFNGRIEKTAAYHDPCYLGRHNGIYDDPRAVLRAIPGLRLVEMARSRSGSFCCGGGGGRMWLESDVEHRISELRVQDAAQAGAELLVTACPYCLSNLTDSMKVAGYGDRIEVRDIVELVAEVI